MKNFALKSLTLALAISTVVACGRGGPNPDINDPEAPVTADDIVNVDDILLDDAADAAAAAQVGDPATLLGAAQEAGTTIRGHMRDVFDMIKNITDTEPAETGRTERGDRPYALWTGTHEDIDFRFGVVRTGPARVRYLMQAKQTDAEEFRNILTGVFVKRAPHRGGGRLHINLSAASDVRGADIDGSVHVVFANGRDDKQGRRIAYLGLRDRNDPDATPQAFGADLIRKVGEGGRFRTLHVADMNPDIPGFEAIGLRVLWKTGQGGRADAVVARVAPRPVVILGHAHECFDGDGLRTGYADTFPGNDEVDPNEGEVTDCLGFAQEDVPDNAAESGNDADPELDDLLAEDGALDIDEEEAADETEI
jgi:predicted small lipoprotein YifL